MGLLDRAIAKYIENGGTEGTEACKTLNDAAFAHFGVKKTTFDGHAKPVPMIREKADLKKSVPLIFTRRKPVLKKSFDEAPLQRLEGLIGQIRTLPGGQQKTALRAATATLEALRKSFDWVKVPEARQRLEAMAQQIKAADKALTDLIARGKQRAQAMELKKSQVVALAEVVPEAPSNPLGLSPEEFDRRLAAIEAAVNRSAR